MHCFKGCSWDDLDASYMKIRCIRILFDPLSFNFILFSGEVPDISKELERFAVFYVYVGLAAIVFGYFQNMLWLYASINQALRIRTLAFESILRQDIGFFDTNDAGELSSRLAE